MGEVYRAKDTKLGRDVAIKVLPHEFAASPERLARFQREATVLASLNHPNIGAIYGLEESGSVRFLVLELVPGETRDERLEKRPLPLAEALELASQIADALSAAHDKGVIHRDLKPANIKITPEGQIKVLDFGLAKALVDEPGDRKHSDSPTLSAHAARVGVILGTAAYMSPEQARGRPVDKRTDIFSFGAVLYEMLTGRQLFQGEDAADTMASVIRSDPDFRALPAELPPRVRELLARCLEKDPNTSLRCLRAERTSSTSPTTSCTSGPSMKWTRHPSAAPRTREDRSSPPTANGSGSGRTGISRKPRLPEAPR
jgi:serine/threonine-protein kinase